MTSQFKVQGSLKGLLMAVAVAAVSMASMQANAARPAPVAPPAGVVRPVVAQTPPPPVVVIPACKRGGPGITPC